MKIIKRIIIVLIILSLALLVLVLSINEAVKASSKSKILEINELKQIRNIDAIIILGAGVKNNNPSPMLKDRLEKGIDLYKNGVSPKIIMSGDHTKKDYDEVNVMKTFAKEQDVPSEDIFMDHAGISTYDSIYRAKEIFKVKKVVIVTQEYHLYRALFIANELGLEAYGVKADTRKYRGEFIREVREILARNKDFVKSIVKPKSTYLGEPIPVSGNGDITNDKSD